MNRYICIHGHFYQPPRENPWLEEIEIQDSAYPYHDWNERITAECYAKNASSRILGTDRTIIDIVNNYSKISFNFGPTLLSWLEKNSPDVYQAILQADRDSQNRFSGHGSAIAQVYNHIIMPLATTRDKHTEVIWGLKDFVYRFARNPEGMWLPETAVDIETLEILAKYGVVFTILAPHQAQRFRKIQSPSWIEVNGGDLETGRPYLCRLPSGKSINLFFYHKSLAYEVAFGNLLENGDAFVKRIVDTFPKENRNPHLISIATDGETYGHHHQFADMALAYALHRIESAGTIKITNYGEFLSIYPPEYEVEIQQDTSWSCIHGIERWKQNCGCRTNHACLITDSEPCNAMDIKNGTSLHNTINWNQKWRVALRNAMDWLSQQINEIYEKQAEGIIRFPWDARNEYIQVIQDRSINSIDQFLLRHIFRPGAPQDRVASMQLFEMQRNGLLMYTSCGWFFDDISGIETVQVMQYACRAMQLAKEVCGVDLEPTYLTILENALSNLSRFKNGAEIYRSYVQTAAIDVSRAAFQFAIMSLFESYPEETRITPYTIKSNVYKRAEEGSLHLVIGNACFRSYLTLKESIQSFAGIYLGNHNLVGGAGVYTTEEEFSSMYDAIMNAFFKDDVLGMVLSLNAHFKHHSYSLEHLTRDGKNKVIRHILDSTLSDIESEYRELYNKYFPLMKAMKDMEIKTPDVLEYVVRYILNLDIQNIIEQDEVDLPFLKQTVDAMIKGKYKPELDILGYKTSSCITRAVYAIMEQPKDVHLIENVNQLFTYIQPLSLQLDLWDCQNQYYRIGLNTYREMQTRANTGDESAQKWLAEFLKLGTYLKVHLS